MIFDLDLPPSPLEPRVEAFRTAWSRADASALLPFFRESGADKMQALVERKIAGNWFGLEPGRTVGEQEAHHRAARSFGSPDVETTFPLKSREGELVVRWKFHDETDAWYVAGFKFP